MKVSKVNSTRVAVLSNKINNSRVVLYPSSIKKDFENKTIEQIFIKRVENANKLYNVFFKADKNKRQLPNRLEEKFTWLMNSMELRFRNQIIKAYKSGDKEEIEKCISKEIDWLMSIPRIEKIKWEYRDKKFSVQKKAEFHELRTDEITDKLLNEVIVRMRKTLKRGSNRQIVFRLIKALATGERASYVNAIKDMNQTDKQSLMKYIDSVNKDYYKTNILSSLAHHDVKVQVNSDLLDLANVNNSKGNKSALTIIMENYASSPEGADNVLLEMKQVFFEYFFYLSKERADFFGKENLWKVPSEELKEDVVFAGYFDEGFEVADKYKNKSDRAIVTIEELILEAELDFKKIRNRVSYVNYGKYLQLISNQEMNDEKALYWINYAKEFVEKNYVNKERKDISAYNRIRMFKACWKEAVRFLCGKYIDLGKAVYHFAMPKKTVDYDNRSYGVILPEYENGISSFSYEAIKAEETLQRNIAISTVAALSAFSRSVLDYEKQQREKGSEDILFIKDDMLPQITKKNALKELLKYFGGQSEVEQLEINENELIQEMIEQFKLIRNENFHYTPGKLADIKCENTLKLWKNDINIYAKIVRQKYYSNNVVIFYPEEKIVKLVGDLYSEKHLNAQQVPAFKTIWKRKELPAYINTKIKKTWLADSAVRTIYEGALYFLLKEIYYNDFIVNDEQARKLFVEAVREYKGTKGVANSQNAAENFKEYINSLNEQDLTFAQICQMVNQEYNQQNANVKQEKGLGSQPVFEHFKMLLPLCVQLAYKKYVESKYEFLLNPNYDDMLQGEQSYLNDVAVNCGVKIVGAVDTDNEKRRIAWFSFAHFIHPKQLNFLIGDFKSYIQYREDVLRRAKLAKQYSFDSTILKQDEADVENSVNRAKSILEVLEFVRPISGRVSNNFDDYYNDKEDYARYLGNYIDFANEGEASFAELVCFCKETLDGQMIDIYADEKNPKVLRNVEIARMYAGGDVILEGIQKVNADLIRKYYKNKEEVAQLLTKELRDDRSQQQKIVNQQNLKGKLTLNDVTDNFAMVNDLLGQLVSMAYLRERDKMYLLLGFYYMALRNASNWSEEVMDSLEEKSIAHGLVLYQVMGLFDFGTKFIYLSSKEKWEEKVGMSLGMKEERFDKMHYVSKSCALKLFENSEYSDEIRFLRNYVDHFKYYLNFEMSITELYAEFYTKFFTYSTKLRKSVIANFGNILEKYFVENTVEFNSNQEMALDLLKEVKSKKNTYKIKMQKDKKDTCECDARNRDFIVATKAVLNYKKMK